MTLENIRLDTCVVRRTNARRGRTRSVEPGRTAMRQLHYGRIILEAAGAALEAAGAALDAADSSIEVDPGGLETGLVCLKGSGAVRVGDRTFEMTPYDALYIPRATRFTVTPGPSGADFAELGAKVERAYPLQFVRFADVQKDPGLHFHAGGPASERDLNILIGKNVEAGRIMAGVTFSQAGNWTSWPPHEHGVLAEEAYLYIDMPEPAFGIQLVYTDKREPELATIVREGDVVLMPQGFHPNVAAPGGSIAFLWMMAAHRETVDRQFGVVNVHPDYASSGFGLDAGRASDAKK